MPATILIIAFATLACSMTGADQFQGPPTWDEPILVDGQLVFPEGARIPKFMTEIEDRLLGGEPVRATRGATSPPQGVIRAASEYEAMDGILLAWEGYTTIVRQMAAAITTTGDADVFVACDSNSEANSARSSMISAGADASRIHTIVRTTDSIWIRDYGPRYIFEGDCRAIVDHVYNRPRPNDDVYSSYFKDEVNHAYYEHNLVHGGGNYHLNSTGLSAATELILNENPGLSQAAIISVWRDFQNVETFIHDAFPSNIDSTQHIDMWMQIIGPTQIIISDWPNASGSTQDQICDWAANYYNGLGWSVYRTPAFKQGWTHFTYTNMVLCNGLVLLPKYNDISNTYDTQALNTVQAAMPSRTVVQITCDDLAYSAGVMHCICMHMPAHVGGAMPTTCLRTPVSGTIDPADCIEVSYISDDDKFDVTSVVIEYSLDGVTGWMTLASGLPAAGSTDVCLPDIPTTQGRLRVLAHDGDGNSGGDVSGIIIVEGDPVPGDVNGDGIVNVEDVLIVIAQWNCQGECAADLNDDQIVDVNDILIVLAAFGN